MRTGLKLVLLGIVFVAQPIIAGENTKAAVTGKPGKMVVTRTRNTLELVTGTKYDKFIISISGDRNYSFQNESNSPLLDVRALKLADGTYSYEFRATKYIAEVEDSGDNGRSVGATGKISIVDVTSGQFSIKDSAMKIDQKLKEPKVGVFPTPQ